MILSQVTETFQNEDQSWLGSAHGTDMAQSITLDTSAFTAGTHYPNGYFPSGLCLGKITATGLYGPYDNAAADGRQTAVGFLFCSVDAPSVNTVDVPAALLDHGRVILAKLPIAVDSAGQTELSAHFILV